MTVGPLSLPAPDRPRGLRTALFGATLLLGLVVQSTILPRVGVMGVVPQALLVLVISFAYLEGEVAGPIVGFTSGLLLDLLLPGSVLGLSALLYTLVGYGAARFGAQGPGDQLVTPVVAVLVGSVVAEAGYAILSVGLGRPWVSLGQTVRIVLLVVIYNTLLAAILFPLVRRIALYVRPQRVVKI